MVDLAPVNLDAQSGLLAAIVCAAVAVSVLLRGRRVLVNVLFTVFAATLFAHFLAAFFLHLSGKHLWLRVDLISVALLPVSAMLFFGHYLWREPGRIRVTLWGIYGISGLLVLFLLTPWSDNEITLSFTIGYVFLSLYLCAYFVFLRFREMKSGRERVRFQVLLTAMLVAVTFSLLGVLPIPLEFLRAWGDLVAIFFLYLVSQSLIRVRLLDLQDLLGRALVLFALALILALVFWVLVFSTGGPSEFPLFHTFVASFVILILFEPLRDKLEGSTKLLLLRERYELSRKLEDLRREIANIIDPKQMTQVLLDTVYDRMRMSHVNVYFQDDGGASFRLLGHRGAEPPARIDVAAHRAFFEQLKRAPTAVPAESFERQVADQGVLVDAEPTGDVKNAKQILETLALLHSRLCIPFMGQKNEILGLWNLYDESAGEGYTTEEIARLMAVGEQAAIVIENSRMYARVRERDRLAVLGQMSAGLAHEIRNPLGAIKGAAQYLDPSAPGEDVAEFLRIIVEETDRLNQVVNQFLDYARPLKEQHASINVFQVIGHTGKLLAPLLEGKRVTLRLELDDKLPQMEGNGQQLTQVFLNLMNNAVEAMPDGGTLTVRAQKCRDGTGFWPGSALRSGALEIQVIDTGRGIQPEALERIFVPFYTTKERGTGLGLAICQRIIENHGGEMRVRSKVGEGSTFTVFLPAKPPSEAPASPPSAPVSSGPAAEADRVGADGLPFPGEHGKG